MMGRLLFFWFTSFLTTSVCYWRLTAAFDGRSQEEDRLSEDMIDPRNEILSPKQLSAIGLKLNRHNSDEEHQLDFRRSDLQLIRKILRDLKTDGTPKKKRTCLFNLGGHCSTESAAFLADRWHYLDSPMSPGRKRLSKAATDRETKMEETEMINEKE